MQVDNAMAINFSSDELKQKCTKAIDMRFYCIRDRTEKKQSMIYCITENGNLGDYHTRNHPAAHH